MIYQKQETIGIYDIDANGMIKLTALLKYMSEASWLSAEELGAGIDKTLEVGLAFIIQRIGIRIFKTPKLNQKVMIKTWPAETTRSAFKRNGAIYDEAGNKILEWESLWVLIDINERRIKRPSAFPIEFPLHGKMDIEIEADKVALPEKKEHLGCYNHPIQFSELDINAHMNNAIYGDLIANILATHDSPDINTWTDIHFNYVHEAKLNDKLTVDYYQADNSLYVTGSLEEKTIFTTAIKYKELS